MPGKGGSWGQLFFEVADIFPVPSLLKCLCWHRVAVECNVPSPSHPHPNPTLKPEEKLVPVSPGLWWPCTPPPPTQPNTNAPTSSLIPQFIFKLKGNSSQNRNSPPCPSAPGQ